jgi:hypothetical protein
MFKDFFKIEYKKVITLLFFLNILFLIFEYTYFQYNGFTRDLGIGLFISFLFYYMVVYIPNWLDKKAQKKVFLNFYEEFRRAIIKEILILSEFDIYSNNVKEKTKELLDVEKLDSFFKEDNKKNSGQKNYQTIMNNIISDSDQYKWSLDVIANQINELKREMNFLVSKIQIDDQELLEWMRRMDRMLSDGRFKKDLDWQFSDEKQFVENLWTLLTEKNLYDNYIGDFIKDKIKAL